MKKVFLKIKNPANPLYCLARNLANEFQGKIETDVYWFKITKNGLELKLHHEPITSDDFDFIFELRSKDRNLILFCKYLLENLKIELEKLEKIYSECNEK